MRRCVEFLTANAAEAHQCVVCQTRRGAEGDAKPLRPEDAAPPPAVAGKDLDEYVRFARVVGVPGRNAFQASLVARDEGALALSEFDGLK
jgi:hypothetical protein